ncbi:hypothetical protein F5I97DRAFT_1812877 [Phlebopus sp. FC_14]|nr:hypothetical protein F5I97DRAFT_1812877 [Phlebopus sp. FC_14]
MHAQAKSGQLPSDRIPPKQPPSNAKQPGRGESTAPPKNKVLISPLESLAANVRDSSGREKDPKGGCFCQAREHSLSTYVSLCQYCGLILCSLNMPYYACPHCSKELLDAYRRSALLAQLEDELTKQRIEEEEARLRAIEEARKAAGDFPVLAGSANQPRRPANASPVPSTYKVMSLDSKKKKVTVSSYTNTPTPSRPPSRVDHPIVEPHRVPPPPPEISYVKEPPDPKRPWKNARMGTLRYIPPAGEQQAHKPDRQR